MALVVVVEEFALFLAELFLMNRTFPNVRAGRKNGFLGATSGSGGGANVDGLDAARPNDGNVGMNESRLTSPSLSSFMSESESTACGEGGSARNDSGRGEGDEGSGCGEGGSVRSG